MSRRQRKRNQRTEEPESDHGARPRVGLSDASAAVPASASSSSFPSAPSAPLSAAESHRLFESRIPMLYDLCTSYGLTWPSLTMQWLQEDEDTQAGGNTALQLKMLLGTHTSGQGPNEILQLHVSLPNARGADPLHEFLRHPLTAPLSCSMYVDDPDQPYSALLPHYNSCSMRVSHKQRTAHELHRIRVQHPNRAWRERGTGSLTEKAQGTEEAEQQRDEEGDCNMRDSSAAAASSTPSTSAPALPSNQRRCLAATKGPDPEVQIYAVPLTPFCSMKLDSSTNHADSHHPSNVRKHGGGRKSGERPLFTLTGHETGGWTLDWNAVSQGTDAGLVLSGDDNGALCYWNIEDLQSGITGDGRASSPNGRISPHLGPTLPARHCWSNAHAGVINDATWLKSSSAPTASFASVGDDGFLRLWDPRQPTPSQQCNVHQTTVESVSASAWRPFDLLTASKDRTVALWDIRKLQSLSPVRRFLGHGDGVRQVSWAPFSHHDGAVFASSALDNRIMVWDASLVGAEEAEGGSMDDSGPPELLFVHSGHTSVVEDFCWHPNQPWLMSSVGEDNVLQIWQVYRGIHEEIDARDQKVVDEIAKVMQEGNQGEGEEGLASPFSFDLQRCLALVPDQLHSALFQADAAALLNSPALQQVAAFVQSYSSQVDERLQGMELQPDEELSSSSESEDAESSRHSSPVQRKRRKLASPDSPPAAIVSVKLKKQPSLEASSAVSPSKRGRSSSRAASDSARSSSPSAPAAAASSSSSSSSSSSALRNAMRQLQSIYTRVSLSNPLVGAHKELGLAIEAVLAQHSLSVRAEGNAEEESQSEREDEEEEADGSPDSSGKSSSSSNGDSGSSSSSEDDSSGSSDHSSDLETLLPPPRSARRPPGTGLSTALVQSPSSKRSSALPSVTVAAVSTPTSSSSSRSTIGPSPERVLYEKRPQTPRYKVRQADENYVVLRDVALTEWRRLWRSLIDKPKSDLYVRHRQRQKIRWRDMSPSQRQECRRKQQGLGGNSDSESEEEQAEGTQQGDGEERKETEATEERKDGTDTTESAHTEMQQEDTMQADESKEPVAAPVAAVPKSPLLLRSDARAAESDCLMTSSPPAASSSPPKPTVAPFQELFAMGVDLDLPSVAPLA